MQRKYFTKKEGIYIQEIKGGRELWIKREKNGQSYPLMGGIHISRKKLEELIRKYRWTGNE